MVQNRSRLAVLLVTAALVLAACGSSSSDSGASSGESGGSTAPSFTAKTLEGGELASASFAGKPTVLWFWAPWCTICRAEAPDVNEAAAAFKGKVDLVGVAGRGEVPEMKGFLSDTGTGDLTHVIDADGSIWSDYGVAAQPAFAFIDAKGKVDVTVGSLGKDALEKRMKDLAAA